MKRWTERDDEIARRAGELATSNVDVLKELRDRLRMLVDKHHCPPMAPHWLRKTGTRKTGSCIQITASAQEYGRHPAIELKGLHHVDPAYLTLIVTLEPHVPTTIYSIGLSGTRVDTKSQWFARVDLDSCSRGHGPCGHGRLHVHVGTDPGERFATRVPCGWLTPWEALEWLLANVHPALEPAR